ncbi:hypothetical protein EG850_12190 [Gulosibacter macacae]|uniref:Uncharacterized protein n=1 Tax=Gulosibacter macacae TaxID=2488791 RepID=A0A3P3VSE6_9MICO|nr:hypothetical protein [Gulosibacter macacae]RRJ85675.1 hypothetical protein EG850_12190 [Gulosibacter macacae]
MTEHQVRPAPEHPAADWRRLDVAYNRYGDRIAEGITNALAQHTEIDDTTARCIAHVLGRGRGRQSALAEFGRTGEGGYESLRDEYLDLYTDERASAATKELIDWLGTYLVQRDNHGSGRRFMNAHLPPKLEQLLVRTGVEVGDWYLTVHVPASCDRKVIDELVRTLHELHLDKDPALQAFLSLPDVNAMNGDIMESFHENYVGTYATTEDAVHGLLEIDEWEKDVNEFAADRGLLIDGITPDYEALLDRVREAYDLAEHEGAFYAFYR